jgi:predicted DNA-binding transcriptional regulator YafY
MLYKRSQEIERRLDQVLHLIQTGRYSTPTLAEAVGVSIPTISRCVTALRERGHDIRAENGGNGWRFVLHKPTPQRSPRTAERTIETSN